MPQPKIILRTPEQSDVTDFWALYKCPQRAGPDTHPALFFARAGGGDVGQHPQPSQGDRRRGRGQTVGLCTLYLGDNRRRHSGDLGIMVRDDHVKRGIGDALLTAMLDLAENWLGLTRIEMDVFCDNQAAVRLYEKHGFQIEGTQRAWALRDGAYVDAYLMARVKPPN